MHLGWVMQTLIWFQRVQNYAARIIVLLPKCVTNTLTELHWLPVKYRILYKIVLTVYKCVEDKALEYLKELLVVKDNNQVLRSQHIAWNPQSAGIV